MSFVGLGSLELGYILFLSAVLGAVFGSFVTCQAERIASGKDWVKGRSHCDVCGHTLGLGDLIPIVSYVIHGGKCKYCGTKLSSKYVWSEIGMALAFVGITLKVYAFSFEILMDWGFVCALYGLSIVDMKKYEIPNGYLIFSIAWWLVGMFLMHLEGMNVLLLLKDGLIGGFVISGALLLLSLVMDKVLKKESMGGGDIKLFFVVGLYLGTLNTLFTLVVACVVGLLFVFVLKKDKIPFGPAISIATYLGLTVMPYFVYWYISLL